MANDITRKPNSTKAETVHLRAYIHCEGCKKKVNKILNKIDGVHSVEIQASIGKVSVTGTADLKTLIKMLGKSGKVVEAWPSPPQHNKSAAPNSLPLPKRDSKSEDAKGQKMASLQPSPLTAGDASTPLTPNTVNAKSRTKLHEDSPKQRKREGEDAEQVINCGSKSADKQSSDKSGDNSSTPGPQTSKAKSLQCNRDDKHINDTTPSPPSKSKSKTAKASNGGATPNAGNQKVVNETSTSEGEKVASPGDQEAGDTAKSSSTARKKKQEGSPPHAGDVGSEAVNIEASTTTITANRHMAPPSMVLVETTEYSEDMELRGDYTTHMFSDENANSCIIM